MKSLVVYYSHYGNTSLVTYNLLKALTGLGEAQIIRLDYSKGRRDPITRLMYKLIPSLVELVPVPADMKEYDVLCLGIPVLAGLPSSAISKYISICKNLADKKIICCYVYGFEANAKRCSRYVKRLLEKKGRPVIIEMFVPWNQVHNQKVLDKSIEDTIKQLTSDSAPPTQ